MTDMNVQTSPATSNIETDNWREWNPGLENGELTLRAVFNSLPGAGPDEIDQMVRLLENPARPTRCRATRPASAWRSFRPR